MSFGMVGLIVGAAVMFLLLRGTRYPSLPRFVVVIVIALGLAALIGARFSIATLRDEAALWGWTMILLVPVLLLLSLKLRYLKRRDSRRA